MTYYWKFKIGDLIDYKLKGGRGRPQYGRITKHLGIAVMVVNSLGEEQRVPLSRVFGWHITRYKPRRKHAS